MSKEPRIIVESVVAYRVRVEPQSAVHPYASGEPEIFTNHTAAAFAAKDYGAGWSFPVVDLTGEAGHG